LLAVALKDLTFLEEGNPDTLSNGGINFYKWRKIAGVIQEIMEFQTSSITYDTVINQRLQSYIQVHLRTAVDLGNAGLYKLSKKAE
jgi:hypothetical protein